MNLPINHLSPNQIEFLCEVRNKCDKHKILLLLNNSQAIEFKNTNIMCNGYFIDSPHPELAVAINKDIKDWFMVLVHEYSHLEQWVEKSPFWTNNKLSNCEASDLIDSWINLEIELSSKKLDELFNIVILLEAECESRAIKNIDKFKLEINKEEYAQKANSYILFYHVVKKHRRWYKVGQEPYSINDIWKKMPKKMNLDYRTISKKHLEILEKCL